MCRRVAEMNSQCLRTFSLCPAAHLAVLPRGGRLDVAPGKKEAFGAAHRQKPATICRRCGLKPPSVYPHTNAHPPAVQKQMKPTDQQIQYLLFASREPTRAPTSSRKGSAGKQIKDENNPPPTPLVSMKESSLYIPPYGVAARVPLSSANQSE